MRQYNTPRSRNLYTPESNKPYPLSRSRIELFRQCMRCFYIDRRLGIDKPPTYEFKLNLAVDKLLKNEFDTYRESGASHPLIKESGIDARPAQHEQIDTWRDTYKGVRHLHKPTNLDVFGGIDDLWVDSEGQYHIVDYKATARDTPVATIDNLSYGDGYKRQFEVYQWLLRRNGLDVSDTAYWVYATGRQNEPQFDSHLDFDMHIIPYEGNDSWIEPTLHDIKDTLDSPRIPDHSPDCSHCKYVRAVQALNE